MKTTKYDKIKLKVEFVTKQLVGEILSSFLVPS